MKNVCGCIINDNDISFRCLDCQKSDRCILCAQCFLLSNHRSHKYVIEYGIVGFCDCGDAMSFSEYQCMLHQGKNFQADIQKFVTDNKDNQIDLFQTQDEKLDYLQLILKYYVSNCSSVISYLEENQECSENDLLQQLEYNPINSILKQISVEKLKKLNLMILCNSFTQLVLLNYLESNLSSKVIDTFFDSVLYFSQEINYAFSESFINQLEKYLLQLIENKSIGQLSQTTTFFGTLAKICRITIGFGQIFSDSLFQLLLHAAQVLLPFSMSISDITSFSKNISKSYTIYDTVLTMLQTMQINFTIQPNFPLLDTLADNAFLVPFCVFDPNIVEKDLFSLLRTVGNYIKIIQQSDTHHNYFAFKRILYQISKHIKLFVYILKLLIHAIHSKQDQVMRTFEEYFNIDSDKELLYLIYILGSSKIDIFELSEENLNQLLLLINRKTLNLNFIKENIIVSQIFSWIYNIKLNILSYQDQITILVSQLHLKVDDVFNIKESFKDCIFNQLLFESNINISKQPKYLSFIENLKSIKLAQSTQKTQQLIISNPHELVQNCNKLEICAHCHEQTDISNLFQLVNIQRFNFVESYGIICDNIKVCSHTYHRNCIQRKCNICKLQPNFYYDLNESRICDLQFQQLTLQQNKRLMQSLQFLNFHQISPLFNKPIQQFQLHKKIDANIQYQLYKPHFFQNRIDLLWQAYQDNKLSNFSFVFSCFSCRKLFYYNELKVIQNNLCCRGCENNILYYDKLNSICLVTKKLRIIQVKQFDFNQQISLKDIYSMQACSIVLKIDEESSVDEDYSE